MTTTAPYTTLPEGPPVQAMAEGIEPEGGCCNGCTCTYLCLLNGDVVCETASRVCAVAASCLAESSAVCCECFCSNLAEIIKDIN